MMKTHPLILLLSVALVLGALFGPASPTLAGTQDNAKVVLHLQQRATYNPCDAVHSDLPCSQFSTAGATGVGYDAFLIIANASPADGIGALSCGLLYNGDQVGGATMTDRTMMEMFGWTMCASGLQFPNGPTGDIQDEWPASGGGNRITWDTSVDCQISQIGDYETEGVHAVAGVFYVYAYTDDLFRITPNNLPSGSEFAVGDCQASLSNLPESSGGSVRFTTGGTEPGTNPCSGAWDPPPLPPAPPPPPPPPPPVPVPDPAPATVLLHIGAVTQLMTGCGDAPTARADVVTSAAASGDGSASYYVYLMGTPAYSGNPLSSEGLAGMQCGIGYTPDTGAADGIAVWSWRLCADVEFDDDEWPAPGSGNTIVWDKDANCQYQELANAGYFYLTAYAASTMDVVGWPTTGLVKVGNCEGSEVVIDEVLDLAGVGWLSLGGAAKGADSDGCNPALESCVEAVAVEPTSWGRIKTMYE